MRISPPTIESMDAKAKAWAEARAAAEQLPTYEVEEPTFEEKVAEFTRLWESDEKLEAMEAVLGERIDARDLSDDPILSQALLQASPESALDILAQKSKQ